MDILVFIHAIQDPAGLTVNRRAQKVFVNQPGLIFNPADRNALEVALRLGGAVTAAAVGEAGAEQVLRDARALGASRAVWVKDRALDQAEASLLARVFQRVAEHAGPVDLVLCGESVLDADQGQAGPRLAQLLGWPFVASAHELSLADGELQAVTGRAGAWQKVAASLPAVAAVARDANQPRFAPGAHIINTYRDPQAIEIVSPADLGLAESDLAPAAEFQGEAFPPERTPGQRVEGDLEKQARAVAQVLSLYR